MRVLIARRVKDSFPGCKLEERERVAAPNFQHTANACIAGSAPENSRAMANESDSLTAIFEKAATSGELLESAAQNIRALLRGSGSALYSDVVRELAEAGQWDELNDRFYKTLAFGTGGLRGRTIGKVLTKAERGTPDALGRPEFPCVGTNAMNYYNIGRATQGLVAYLHDWFAAEKLPGKPKIVIAHDTRHFSPEFSAFTAKIAAENGCGRLCL